MQLQLNTPINPAQIHKPVVKAAVQYVMVTFTPEEWATARVLFLDEDSNVIISRDVIITLEESQQWLWDDNYILNLALQKINIPVQ
jgi:hypothetical protein